MHLPRKLLLLAYAYLIAGVATRFALVALHTYGIYNDSLASLCSKLFEGPFVFLFGIW